MKKYSMNYSLLAAACVTFLSAPVYAANWLMLQGTEPSGAADRAKVWGFVQPEFQSTDGSEVAAGGFSGADAQFNQIAPNLESSNTFQIRRARIGVRGTGFPLDSNVNYFLLTEFGNNGITNLGGDGAAKVTDASVTLNNIKGARIRIGQFKYPGSEEGLQAIHVADYINFTNVTNQMMLERFFDSDGAGTGAAVDDINAPNGPVGAFRDIGVQVFDAFKMGGWEHSYAVMYGNGNGIARADNNEDKDTYLYWSSEQVYSGKGGRRQGLKFYVWQQSGKRTLYSVDGVAGEEEFDRTRQGVGATYRKGKYRAGFEYIAADGMIFNGTDGGAVAGSANGGGTAFSTFNLEEEEKADGYYVDFGYKILSDVELDARYDILNRATEDDTLERTFETLTLGAQWFMNKKSRVVLNYEMRNAEAPNLSSSSNANLILDDIDDRLSVQYLAIF